MSDLTKKLADVLSGMDVRARHGQQTIGHLLADLCAENASLRARLADMTAQAGMDADFAREKDRENAELRAQLAGRVAVPEGWAIRRNSDGSIGVFAPPPTDGESKRTSHAIYPGARSDLAELMFKFFTHLLAAAPEPVQTKRTAMSCKHGNWSNCEQCAEEEALWDRAYQAGFKDGKAQAAPSVPEISPEELLNIARKTDLRWVVYGVEATAMRAMLACYVAAIDAHRAQRSDGGRNDA